MTEFAQSHVHIVNRALTKLGLPASFSIGTETSLGGIVDLVWPGVVATVVPIYDWSFTRKTVRLTRLSATPENGWQYGFALPGDRVGEALAVLTSALPPEAYLRSYAIEAGALYANCDPLWLRYRTLLDPDYWDDGFKEAFATALASALAVPMTQDLALEKDLHERAYGREDQNYGGGLFGKLVSINRAAQPQGRRFLDNDPLTQARFG